MYRHSEQEEGLMNREFNCFELERIGDVAVARFRRGNLDDGWINQLGEELIYLIDEEGVRKLVISFNDMECLYSLLLGKLMRAKRHMDAAKGRLKLMDIPPLAREVFAVCKLDVQFNFAPNRESAIKDW
jgi:anti-anti-sigma regulatory factor